MTQRFKNVYYTDFPSESSHKKNLTIAFGDRDGELYELAQSLSSQEMRELLGHETFTSLQSSAESQGLAVNTYCLHLLRKKLRNLRESSVQYALPGMALDTAIPIDPIQVTFKGGQHEPLHQWYPFLEGYSPSFVRQILGHFAPKAIRILDPFSGTGTTPLTIARLGKQALYCEINPLLQYLVEIKTTALTMDSANRRRLTELLKAQSISFEQVVTNSREDAALACSYQWTFGSSEYFNERTFREILKARTVIDQIACVEPTLSQFVTIAVLASLIPSSHLIRRGDLRYKTELESTRGQEDFFSSVRRQIQLMAADLERISVITERPQFVCEDARHLDRIPFLDVNAVVTSPPYLNGTNYFRNAKVELWFLRCLHSKTDLTAYRQKAVTAGINDVTVGKLGDRIGPEVEKVVQRLAATAYDPRIPRMVASYFSDMAVIFEGIGRHISAGATLLIDIGDSQYGGIHVPTDRLLLSTLQEMGFNFNQEVILRRRLSRNGQPLRQVLLVLDAPRRAKIAKERSLPLFPAWQGAWQDFTATLPHQRDEFAKRNWGHPLHSLCSYQGKMKPSLASHLVRTFVSKGGSLLDPFAGVGTIPFEAALQGIKAWGFDISPTAIHISAAKLGRPNEEVCHRLLDSLEVYLESSDVADSEIRTAQTIHFNGSLPDYFDPLTFREILLARRYFQQNPPKDASGSMVLAALLHILHGNRPYALSRRSHPITPFSPSGPFEYRALLPRLREKVRRSLAVNYPEEFVAGEVLFQDATSWWPQSIHNLDAVITSPPFFDSTRFYLANWMRLWFCGWEANDFRTNPLAFVDERQKASFSVYEPIFRQAFERLKPTGVMVLHLGKSRKCDMAHELVDIALRWFSRYEIFTEDVSHCESHGISDKGTVEEHQFLLVY